MKTFVPRHRRQSDKFKPKVHQPERDRRQAMYRGTDEWRNYTSRFLSINQNCYACGAKATVVDHIRPALGDEEWFWREGNYLPLCQTCHNTVTAKFDVRFSPGDSVEPKVAWLNDTRALNQMQRNRTFEKVKIVPLDRK